MGNCVRSVRRYSACETDVRRQRRLGTNLWEATCLPQFRLGGTRQASRTRTRRQTTRDYEPDPIGLTAIIQRLELLMQKALPRCISDLWRESLKKLAYPMLKERRATITLLALNHNR